MGGSPLNLRPLKVPISLGRKPKLVHRETTFSLFTRTARNWYKERNSFLFIRTGRNWHYFSAFPQHYSRHWVRQKHFLSTCALVKLFPERNYFPAFYALLEISIWLATIFSLYTHWKKLVQRSFFFSSL